MKWQILEGIQGVDIYAYNGLKGNQHNTSIISQKVDVFLIKKNDRYWYCTVLVSSKLFLAKHNHILH